MTASSHQPAPYALLIVAPKWYIFPQMHCLRTLTNTIITHPESTVITHPESTADVQHPASGNGPAGPPAPAGHPRVSRSHGPAITRNTRRVTCGTYPGVPEIHGYLRDGYVTRSTRGTRVFCIVEYCYEYRSVGGCEAPFRYFVFLRMSIRNTRVTSRYFRVRVTPVAGYLGEFLPRSTRGTRSNRTR